MTDITANSTFLPSVTCIVLNWNGWRDTIACLDALKQCDYDNLTIIVVDNCSSDESTLKIHAAYPDVPLIQSTRNVGFAGGNNIGIRRAIDQGAQYLWLLNNDTVPDPSALTQLIEKAKTDPQIGAVSSITYFAHAPQNVEVWAGARINLWIGYGKNTTEAHEDRWFHALYGASLLLSRNALENVGFLDEKFFLYWEETELCLRLRKAGWKLAAAPHSRVLHKVHGSTGKNQKLRDRYFTASGLRILRLHSPAPTLAMTIFLCVRFLRRIGKLQFSRCRSVWAGIKDYYLSLHPGTERAT